MRIIPQHVSGHVRDTCMTFLGINTCKFYMLVTCRKCFRINNVSSLRAKGTLMSEPRFSTPCEMRFFPRKKGKRPFQRKPSDKGRFPFLAWEKGCSPSSKILRNPGRTYLISRMPGEFFARVILDNLGCQNACD